MICFPQGPELLQIEHGTPGNVRSGIPLMLEPVAATAWAALKILTRSALCRASLSEARVGLRPCCNKPSSHHATRWLATWSLPMPRKTTCIASSNVRDKAHPGTCVHGDSLPTFASK